MAATWKKGCPYDTEEDDTCRLWPQRRAWREGWVYRKERGPVKPAKEIEHEMTEHRLFSSWLQGYLAAAEDLQEADSQGQE